MTIQYRRFEKDENEVVARIFARGYNELLRRAGSEPYVNVDDPEAWAKAWEPDRRALFEHFAESSNESWVAEDDGEILGYARSILRGGVRQLTDFWVLPDKQSTGIGYQLLEKTFRSGRENEGRVVVATTFGGAVACYLKSGLDVLCPVLEFVGAPGSTSVPTDIDAAPMVHDAPTIAELNRIDRTILGFEREVDHLWFLKMRNGYLYRRQGNVIGYGYVGRWQGPFAALDPNDMSAVLAHAEVQCAQQGIKMMLIIPMANSLATRYALTRGLRMHDKFLLLFMSEALRPRLDRYIFWWPGFC
jgi:GNAT superfamily N-acetyltransferase